MSEQSWTPLFRAPKATVTKVLSSAAFADSRERARAIIEDSAALRTLADVVETIDHTNAPLSAISDRVAAAVRFLRARADRLDTHAGTASNAGASATPTDTEAAPPAAGGAARERLLVAALHYLVTPVDLVPDFRVGGYVDDVLLLSWIFGAAVNELEPHMEGDQDP